MLARAPDRQPDQGRGGDADQRAKPTALVIRMGSRNPPVTIAAPSTTQMLSATRRMIPSSALSIPPERIVQVCGRDRGFRRGNDHLVQPADYVSDRIQPGNRGFAM